MPSLPPITQALILVNVALFALDALLGRLLTGLFALWPLGRNFMPWQVVTYSFLHGDFWHLAFNMLGVWSFGSDLERLWGPRRYLQFWFASVLAAAAAQLVVTLLTGSVYPTIGASGGLFGLLLAYGMLFPERRILLLIPPIPMKARTYVIVFGVLALVLGMTSTASGLAHFAHLGGMLGGYLMILYWRRRGPFSRR
jgi:membrane associated rhomboid family serine protease